MREIFFRGKRNGEWIEGNSLTKGKYTFVGNEDSKGNVNFEEIDPETLGIWTGLTDKNGRKIFEGDIVKYKSGSDCFFHKVVFETRNYCGYFGIVISETETWGFGMEVPPNLFEVVGNIYDSPELLEVTK